MFEGQYIGQTDKHKKDIYEGNVVDLCYHEEQQHWICKVVFHQGTSGFYYRDDFGRRHMPGDMCIVKIIK